MRKEECDSNEKKKERAIRKTAIRERERDDKIRYEIHTYRRNID